MNVLMLGANGMLGPHVVKALQGEHKLRITGLNDLENSPHEHFKVDAANLDQVMAAAKGMDAIINLAVTRNDRQLDFGVNARGCYNVMAAAVSYGIRRVINTGPFTSIFGWSYRQFDYLLGPDVPPHPGTELYSLTKSLGQEMCKVFTENHDVYVINLVFWGFEDPEDRTRDGKGLGPFRVTWSDAAEAVRDASRIALTRLSSRCETFSISADLPHEQFSYEKAKRVLGWQSTHQLEHLWRKAKLQ